MLSAMSPLNTVFLLEAVVLDHFGVVVRVDCDLRVDGLGDDDGIIDVVEGDAHDACVVVERGEVE